MCGGDREHGSVCLVGEMKSRCTVCVELEFDVCLDVKDVRLRYVTHQKSILWE